MAVTDFLQPILPLLFCGDEISDILYLIFNWDSFASVYLRNASLAFVVINGAINFICSIVLFANLKGLKNASAMKVVGLTCFCGWAPVLGLVYILLYFKFVDLAIEFKKADSLF